MWIRDLLVGQYTEIERRERPFVLLLSLHFFLTIATFWVLKPLKRSVIINYFGDNPINFFGFNMGGAEAEQVGKFLNVIFAYLAVLLFIWLARRVTRQYLVLIFAAIFAAALLFYASVIDNPTQPIVWSFFVFGDIFNTVMVAVFWAFTNDIASATQARRTYGMIGLGGVLGGFFGATLVAQTVEDIGREPLLLISILPLALISIIAFAVNRMVLGSDDPAEQNPPIRPRRSDTAFRGARLVLRSRYLFSIALLVAFYELVSNIIDYQLAATVEAAIAPALGKDAFFALIGQATGIVSIVVQLVGTGYILQTFGVRTALMALPIIVTAASTGFLILPGLFFAATMSVSDNALNYSINQSAKEVLYTPISTGVMYRAKAFIDMLVQRFAKISSIFLNLLFAALSDLGVRWLSLASLALLGLWVLVVRRAGRDFSKKARAKTARPHA